MVSDLKKPLDRLRLIAHIDFAPQVAGIYDALVPFCEASTDGKSSKNYRKLYPSDLQQLYSSYYDDAGVVNKSFACGSPNFPGLSTQAAEDDVHVKMLSEGVRCKKTVHIDLHHVHHHHHFHQGPHPVGE